MKLTIVEKNLLSWTAMHIDFVMCNINNMAVKSSSFKSGERPKRGSFDFPRS